MAGTLNLPKLVDVSSVDFSTHVVLTASATDTQGFAVPRDAGKYSELIRNMVETADAGDELKFPINDYHVEAVRAIAAYLTHFSSCDEEPRANEIPRPFPEKVLVPPVPTITPFEREFATQLLPELGSRDLRMHITLLNAANYLCIRDLLLLLGCCLAMRFKGKDLEDIRALISDQLPLTVEDKFEWPHRIAGVQ